MKPSSRLVDALVIAAGLSILALCSWPAAGAMHPVLAWPLLFPPGTTP